MFRLFNPCVSHGHCLWQNFVQGRYTEEDVLLSMSSLHAFQDSSHQHFYVYHFISVMPVLSVMLHGSFIYYS